MKNQEKTHKTAIAYLRTSTEGQGKYGTSLDGQREKIKNFCHNNNIVLLETFVETYSGKDFKRPNYQKAYEFIKLNRNDIDLFLTMKVDRFTRDAKSGLETFDEIKKLGIEVNFADEWIDNINSAQGRMILSLKMTFAEYERLSIVERTRFGERNAMRAGRYIFAPPRGYKRTKLINVHSDFVGKKGIIPNDDAIFIKGIFEDYAKGIYKQAELVEAYKHKGFKTSTSAISRILENPIYAGLIDLKKYKIEPFDVREGIHEPLISEELFYKVQDLKNGRNRMIKKTRSKNPEFPLSAGLICVNCGSVVYGYKNNNGKQRKKSKEFGYYGCSDNCGQSALKPNIVHKEFLKALSKVKPSPNIVKLFQEVLIQQYKSSIIDTEEIKNKIQRKITLKEKERISLTKKYAVGNIPDYLYQDTLEEINSELKNLKVEKSKYGDAKKGLDEYLTFGLNLIMNLDTVFKNAPIDVQVQLLGSYFTERLVFDGKKFRTLPFNETIMLLCKYNKVFQRLQTKNGGRFFNQPPNSTSDGT